MKRLLLTILSLSAAASLSAQTLQMKVNVNKPGAEIQPTMYGIFIEDINFAADGGLYAELVKKAAATGRSLILECWDVECAKAALEVCGKDVIYMVS